MKLARWIVLACVVSFAAPHATRVANADPDVGKLAQLRLSAAANAYASALTAWKAGRAPIDAPCAWSARWVDAVTDATSTAQMQPQAQAQALADHVSRMSEVSKLAQARYKAGAAGADDVDAATYFLVEAQLWQARGRAR